MKVILIIMSVCLVCVCAIMGYKTYQNEKEKAELRELEEQRQMVYQQMEYNKKVSPLIDAAGKGDIEEVKRLIKEGADVNGIGKTKIDDLEVKPFNLGPNETTALIEAISQGHTEIVKLLLDSGADVYAKKFRYIREGDPAKDEPFYFKLSEENTAWQEALSSKQKSRIFFSNISSAELAKLKQKEKNLDEIIEILKAHGAMEYEKVSALGDAAEKGDKEEVERLIKEGVNVNGASYISQTFYNPQACDSIGRPFGITKSTALIRAIHSSSLYSTGKEIVELLLDAGADVNAKEQILTGVRLKEEISAIQWALSYKEEKHNEIKRWKANKWSVEHLEQEEKRFDEIIELLKAAGAKE